MFLEWKRCSKQRFTHFSHIFIFFRLLLRLLCDSAQQKQLSCMGSHHLAGSSVLLRPGWRLSASLSAFKYILNFLETKSLKSSDKGLLVCKSLHHMTWINQSISPLRGNKTEKSWCIEPYSPHGSISWINKKQTAITYILSITKYLASSFQAIRVETNTSTRQHDRRSYQQNGL